MNHLVNKLLFGCLMSVSASLDVYAAPDNLEPIYLRGECNQWGYNDSYKFNNEGNQYSLHLNELNGFFKIASSDWSTYDFGGTEEGFTISDSEYIPVKRIGYNWRAVNLRNVDISFTLTHDNVDFVKIVVDGKEPIFVKPQITSGTLPILYINVYTDETKTVLNNEINDKDLAHKDYFTYADYWIDCSPCEWIIDEGAKSIGSEEEPLALEIKARGNFTRTGFAKKPFKLKLGKKQNLLGLTPEKSKHYAILAHADDIYGYMRNFVGFNLGKRIGLPWTPAQQPIEVVINGDYRGIYFLTESIRVGDGRVMIEELKDNASDPMLISGGYLVELDNYDEDNQIVMNEKPYSNGDPYLRITFDTPEEYSDIQRRFITDQFTSMNDLIGNGSNEIWSYLDLDDLARYYLVEEIISHSEAFHGSTYLFRDRGENQKWHFSPLWDCGNAFNGPTDNHFFSGYTFGNTWIHTLIKNNKFREKVEETWKWFMSNNFEGLYDDMNIYAQRIKNAAIKDHERWGNAPRPNSSNSQRVCDNSDMERAKSDAINKLSEKINWIKKQFGNFDAKYPEPQRDETPAAKLPSYIETSVVENIDSTISDSVYFTLEGIRVDRPVKGLYIRVCGDKREKVIIR